MSDTHEPQQDEVEAVARAIAAAEPTLLQAAIPGAPDDARPAARAAITALDAHRAKTARANDNLDALLPDAEIEAKFTDPVTARLTRDTIAARLRAPAARPPLPEVRERLARAIRISIQHETPPGEYVGPCYDPADAVIAALREMGIEI